jgi:hypothetical protein
VMRLAGIPVESTETACPAGPALLWTDEAGGTIPLDSG